MSPDIFDRLVGSNGLDTPTQDKERGINISRLFLTVSSIHRFLDPFTASQVTKWQHTDSSQVWVVFISNSNNFDGEDTMATTRIMIQPENKLKSNRYLSTISKKIPNKKQNWNIFQALHQMLLKTYEFDDT